MVLSNKKLKQRLRSLLAESLAASKSKDPRKDGGGDGDINEQLQSVRLLLASKSQKPRSLKRPKKRKQPPLPEDPKAAEVVEGAQQELNQKEKSRKRKRDGDGDGAQEPAKKKEKKKNKKGKKKEKKKEKKTKNSKDEEEEKANEKGTGSADEVACEKGAAEPVKTDESEVNPKKVYVGGIPYYSMEDDIRSVFEGCGTITEVDCMRFPESGKFRGIAILDFKTEAAATRALALDGADMGGFYLKVQPYKASRTQKTDFTPEIVDGYNRIYAGNLSWDVTEDDLRNLFSDCKISSIRFGMDKETGEFKGYAHVDFDDSVSLTVALKLDQKVVCGRPVRVRCAVPKKAAETKSSSKSAAGRREAETKSSSKAAAGRRDFKVAKRSCYECGLTGHLASACPRKRTVELVGSQAAETTLSAEPAVKKEEDSTNVGNPKKKKRRTCYECGVPGHLSSDCPRKRVGEVGGSGGDR